MSSIRPPCHFNAKQIVVEFEPSIPDARLVDAELGRLVRRLENLHASEDGLVAAVRQFVGKYNVAAQLVARTPGVVEFSVTNRPSD